jgi:hypothetical protein
MRDHTVISKKEKPLRANVSVFRVQKVFLESDGEYKPKGSCVSNSAIELKK